MELKSIGALFLRSNEVARTRKWSEMELSGSCPKLPHLVPVTGTGQQETSVTGTRAHEKPSPCPYSYSLIPVTPYRAAYFSVTGTKPIISVFSDSPPSLHHRHSQPSPSSPPICSSLRLLLRRDSCLRETLLLLLQSPPLPSLPVSSKLPPSSANHAVFSFNPQAASGLCFSNLRRRFLCFSRSRRPRQPLFSRSKSKASPFLLSLKSHLPPCSTISKASPFCSSSQPRRQLHNVAGIRDSQPPGITVREGDPIAVDRDPYSTRDP